MARFLTKLLGFLVPARICAWAAGKNRLAALSFAPGRAAGERRPAPSARQSGGGAQAALSTRPLAEEGRGQPFLTARGAFCQGHELGDMPLSAVSGRGGAGKEKGMAVKPFPVHPVPGKKPSKRSGLGCEWQGRRDSNTQPAVLETAALPLSHSPTREMDYTIRRKFCQPFCAPPAEKKSGATAVDAQAFPAGQNMRWPGRNASGSGSSRTKAKSSSSSTGRNAPKGRRENSHP